MVGQSELPRCQWNPAEHPSAPCWPAVGMDTPTPCFIASLVSSFVPQCILFPWFVYYCFVFNAYVRPRPAAPTSPATRKLSSPREVPLALRSAEDADLK